MPVKIFKVPERELSGLEHEINNFEKQLYDKGMQIINIISAITYEGRLVVIVHYGDKSES
jgi:hypothetical protein